MLCMKTTTNLFPPKLQELRLPHTTTSHDVASGAGHSLGEAVVLRGKHQACGFPPASHLTSNNHIALPLAGLSHQGRR
jgi:hypothetical protein